LGLRPRTHWGEFTALLQIRWLDLRGLRLREGRGGRTGWKGKGRRRDERESSGKARGLEGGKRRGG